MSHEPKLLGVTLNELVERNRLTKFSVAAGNWPKNPPPLTAEQIAAMRDAARALEKCRRVLRRWLDLLDAESLPIVRSDARLAWEAVGNIVANINASLAVEEARQKAEAK